MSKTSLFYPFLFINFFSDDMTVTVIPSPVTAEPPTLPTTTKITTTIAATTSTTTQPSTTTITTTTTTTTTTSPMRETSPLLINAKTSGSTPPADSFTTVSKSNTSHSPTPNTSLTPNINHSLRDNSTALLPEAPPKEIVNSSIYFSNSTSTNFSSANVSYSSSPFNSSSPTTTLLPISGSHSEERGSVPPLVTSEIGTIWRAENDQSELSRGKSNFIMYSYPYFSALLIHFSLIS